MSENEPRQIYLKPIVTFHCAPEDSEYRGERIDRYFGEVVDLIGYNDRARVAFLNIDNKTLGFQDGSNLAPTDDSMRMLRAQDRLVAFILQTRDVFNFIDVTMVCTITPELLTVLQKNKDLLKGK